GAEWTGPPTPRRIPRPRGASRMPVALRPAAPVARALIAACAALLLALLLAHAAAPAQAQIDSGTRSLEVWQAGERVGPVDPADSWPPLPRRARVAGLPVRAGAARARADPRGAASERPGRVIRRRRGRGVVRDNARDNAEEEPHGR